MATLPIIPQPAAAAASTSTDLLGRIYPLLGATSALDLEFWTDAELLVWVNAGFQRLARMSGVFVERDATITVVNGTASYALPTKNISTIHVALDGARLRPASARELEAYSATWTTDNATPTHYLQDYGTATPYITLWKKPIAGGTLAIVEHEYPTTITAGATLPAPDVISDYVLFYTLGEARRKESDAAMPEVAAFCDSIKQLYEEACISYWGVAQ